MSVINDFVQLNSLAEEVKNAISAIQIGYLKGNNEYPYVQVNDLADKYGLMFEKIYKRKNSQINEILNKFNAKRRNTFDELKAPNKERVLAKASEKAVPYILSNFNKFLPMDELSKKNISNKLFPIAKDLELTSIVSLYQQLKEKVNGVNEIDKEPVLAYLQQIYVGYIIAKLSHNPMNKFSRSRFMWTYDEVCNSILKEPVLQEVKQESKKGR